MHHHLLNLTHFIVIIFLVYLLTLQILVFLMLFQIYLQYIYQVQLILSKKLQNLLKFMMNYQVKDPPIFESYLFILNLD